MPAPNLTRAQVVRAIQEERWDILESRGFQVNLKRKRVDRRQLMTVEGQPWVGARRVMLLALRDTSSGREWPNVLYITQRDGGEGRVYFMEDSEGRRYVDRDGAGWKEE